MLRSRLSRKLIKLSPKASSSARALTRCRRDLRHTFGSLLIQDGASLAYVKDQMGHSSIQITVDTYAHLIPGADIAWVDRLDSKTTPHQSAPATHQRQGDSESERVEVLEKNWLPPRDSNPDMLIQSQLSCR